MISRSFSANSTNPIAHCDNSIKQRFSFVGNHKAASSFLGLTAAVTVIVLYCRMKDDTDGRSTNVAVAEERKSLSSSPISTSPITTGSHDPARVSEQQTRILLYHIFKICLTGGPCGGKSTAMSQLSNHLQSLGNISQAIFVFFLILAGFQVYMVPEAATLLITGGVHFGGLSNIELVQFQGNLIKTQMALENAFMEIGTSYIEEFIKFSSDQTTTCPYKLFLTK